MTRPTKDLKNNISNVLIDEASSREAIAIIIKDDKQPAIHNRPFSDEWVLLTIILIPVAGNDMIIDNSNRLHKCVADGWTDKSKTAFFKGLAHGF